MKKLVFLSVLLVFQYCGTESDPSLPKVSTADVTDIADLTAKSGGEIISDGNSSILARGICWDTSSFPTIDDAKTEDGSGNGPFVSSLSGLFGGTTYFVRAYAKNKIGIAYGNQVQFTT